MNKKAPLRIVMPALFKVTEFAYAIEDNYDSI